MPDYSPLSIEVIKYKMTTFSHLRVHESVAKRYPYDDEIANAHSVANFCVVGIRLLVSVWRSVVSVS